jgi:hypothetical protein
MGFSPAYTEEELELIKENYPKGIDFCCKLLPNRNRQAIIVKAQRLGIKTNLRNKVIYNPKILPPLKNRDNIPRRHYLDKQDSLIIRDFEKLSDLTNPYSLYIMGIIWADGYLKQSKSCVKIRTTERDESSLDNIFKNLFFWNKYIRKRARETWFESVEYSLSNPLYKDFLVTNNYLNKSGGSPEKILSLIPENFRHYWILGYFDGDGCISKKDNTILFASCYEQDWSFMEKICKELSVQFQIKQYIHPLKGHRGSTFGIHLFTSTYKFINYLYQNKIQDIGFERKYERCQVFKEKFLNNPLNNVHKGQREEFLRLLSLAKQNSVLIN